MTRDLSGRIGQARATPLPAVAVAIIPRKARLCIFVAPFTKRRFLLKLPDDILNGLVALHLADKDKHNISVAELQKIHKKLAGDRTKKLKLKELSELPRISGDITAAREFVESASGMLGDIERAKRLEAGISELISSPDVQLCKKEWEEEKTRIDFRPKPLA